jgi:hypothetical protein
MDDRSSTQRPLPGRVMRGITEALAQHGALSYKALSILVFGEGFTIPDRSSISRAARAMERKGEVVVFLDAVVTCVARVDFDHIRDRSWVERDWEICRGHSVQVEEMRQAAAAVVKPAAPEAAPISRAELLRQDPRFGDHQDCMSCGMSYAECFVQYDLHVHKAPGHPSPCACTPRFGFWGDGTPTPVHWWDGEPDRCCWHCFHREIKIAPRFSSNGHHPQRHATWLSSRFDPT